MNRRKLLKSAALAPLAVALPTESADVIVDRGNPINYPDKLFRFQEEMWRDYLTHDFNLFILPRGGGKTFMSEIITSDWFENMDFPIGDIGKRTIAGSPKGFKGWMYWRHHNGEALTDDPTLDYLKGFRWETPCWDTTKAKLVHYKKPSKYFTGPSGDVPVPKLTIFATINDETNDFLRNMWYNESLFRKFNCKRFPLGEIDFEYVRDHYEFPKGSGNLEDFGNHKRYGQEFTAELKKQEAFEIDCKFQTVSGSGSYRYR